MTKRQLLLSVVIVWFSLFSAVAVFGGDNPHEQGESLDQASSVLCPRLFQEYWRCCQSWTRIVPLDETGPQWDLAPDFELTRDLTDLPRYGEILAIASFSLCGELYYHEHLWQYYQGTCEGWIRCIGPGSPGEWQGPIYLTSLPGTGVIQTLDIFVLGSYLHQSYWRNNVGYYRTIPFVNNTILWNSASPWTVMQIGDIGLPQGSSGDIQSHSSFVWGNFLYQGLWRGDEGFARKVPISNYQVLWGEAYGWSNPPIPLYLFPGCGSMQAQHDYVAHEPPPWWE